ncbi:MAG: chromate transporter [Anaerovoracaceae bacterium]
MILLTLFLTFFRIGIFSFGGGLAMLPLIFQTVQDFGFMSAEEFSNLVALSQITPGPVAVNAATFIGFSFAGLPGALTATLGVSLPSFLLIITVIKFLDKFNENKGLEAAFTGIRPATVGLIAAAAVFVGQTSMIKEGAGDLLSRVEIVPCLIFIGAFVLISKFKISPVKIILVTAVIGAVICR